MAQMSKAKTNEKKLYVHCLYDLAKPGACSKELSPLNKKLIMQE